MTGKNSSKSLYEQLKKVDSRYYIVWTLFIAMTIPYIIPLSIPIPINEPSRTLYEYIEAVKEDDVILWCSVYGGAYVEIGSDHEVIFIELLEKGAKIMMMGLAPEQAMISQRVISVVKPEEKGYEYGIDYVDFGFLPGGETAIAALSKNIQETFVTDIYGTPAEDIPLMSGIIDANDIDILIDFESGQNYIYFVRHFKTPYGTTILLPCAANTESEVTTFFDAGLIDAYAPGITGAATLELLSGRPGVSLRGVNTVSISQTVWGLFVIIGNIIYWSGRSKKGGQNA